MDKEKFNKQISKESVLKQAIRLGIYVTGILCVSLGIVLCVKSKLGISPISSVPYVLEFILPLSFGTLTMLFHLINSLLQYVLERKLLNVKIMLQVPVAVLFGFAIDSLQSIIDFDLQSMTLKLVVLALSVFFTALGMTLMINMKLVQNPPDGTVNLIGTMFKKDIGKVKVAYDVVCVIVSLAISLVFLRRVEGFGIATVVSAVFVGRTLSLLQRNVGKLLRNLVLYNLQPEN